MSISHSPLCAGGIDLHMHSTASDGSFSPTQVMELAHQAGLSTVSLTDHDTVAGQSEARAAAERLGLRYIAGIELSTLDDGGKYDMLGYGFDPGNTKLRTRLEDVLSSRTNRNDLMMRKMKESGVDMAWDDVMAEVGDAKTVVGRPHMAAAMVKKGIVSTTDEAFEKYLAEGRPLYLPKDVLTSAEAAQLLHDAGGIAVMAHPVISRWKTLDALESQLVHAKSYGLDGLEAYYSLNSPEGTQSYIALADKLGLVKTGGSDFHGSAKPDIKVGVLFENGPAPESLIGDIQGALTRYR